MYIANDIPLCDKSDMAMNALISYNGTNSTINYLSNVTRTFTYQQTDFELWQ